MGGLAGDTLWAAGRPLKKIPDALVKALNATYESGRDYIISAQEHDPEAEELIRCGKLYAKRRNLSFRHHFYRDDDGTPRLRFRMKDKRVYVKRKTT